MEHSGRTCCNADDTNNIKMKIGTVKLKSELSEQCFSLTSTMLCSFCDGDIGVGNKEGICQSQCDNWYNACKNEYLDPYINSHEKLPFCQKDSLVCSKVSNVLENSTEFCEQLGLKVNNKDSNCYDGIPASRSKGRLYTDKKPKPAASPYDSDENWEEKLMKILDANPILIKLIQAIEIIVILVGGYLLYYNIKYCFCKKGKGKRPSIADKKHIQELHQKRLQKMKNKVDGKQK